MSTIAIMHARMKPLDHAVLDRIELSMSSRVHDAEESAWSNCETHRTSNIGEL